MVITMTFAAMAAMADTQADFNRYIKAYNSQVASRQYLPRGSFGRGGGDGLRRGPQL